MFARISSTMRNGLRASQQLRGALSNRISYSVHDWSHIYDGIYKFEDNTLGESVLDLRTQALDFAKKKLSPYAIEWEKNEYFPVEAMREAAEMGFSAIYCKSGTGLSRLEASVIFEALATGCVPTSAYLSIHNMCTWIIDEFGNQQQRDQYIPGLISMQDFSSYCLTEPDSGSDSKAMKTSAVKQGEEYVLNGSKMFISGGSFSSLYIVMAKTSATDVSVFIVPGDAKGVTYGKKEDKMGWTIQPTALVSFDNVRIPAANLIAKEGDGFKIAMKALDGGRINIASCSLGGAAFCL
jgi:alkylation response protein AidB-like acyl-CoA dehydrogenase